MFFQLLVSVALVVIGISMFALSQYLKKHG
jgi:hypothetical protein